MTRMRALLCALGLLAGLLTAGTALAEPRWIVGQRSDGPRYTQLAFGAALDGHYGFGFSPGVMLGIPLIDGGFIPPVNDSFYLEPGLFIGTHFHKGDTYVWGIPEFGPRWNFHLTPNWDAFATIKGGYAIGQHGGFWMRGTVGMNWFFARPWALRLETSGGRHGHDLSPSVFLGLTYEFS